MVSEAALRQQTGGPAVLRNQLEHLITMIEGHETTIDFRVLPFTSNIGAIRGCSTFHILDFARPRLPTLAWSEVPTWDELVEDPLRVRNMTTVFGHLQTESLTRDDSLGFLKQQLADKEQNGR
ncbi:hypothetical protein GFY24_07605 [Nocardia sp. SYP-A9097]|nr:hypothetical protein [Nocardia sp. SYP-A9097]